MKPPPPNTVTSSSARSIMGWRDSSHPLVRQACPVGAGSIIIAQRHRDFASVQAGQLNALAGRSMAPVRTAVIVRADPAPIDGGDPIADLEPGGRAGSV